MTKARSDKISEINLRLKMDGFRVALEARGKRDYLYLTATLPPKPGSNKNKPYQQRIALGYPLSVPGLRRAETQARLLGTQLINQSFSWAEWWEPKAPVSEKPGADQLAAYKIEVFENRLNKDKYGPEELESLWRRRFLDRGLLKLGIDRPLSLADFEAIARDLKPQTAQARYVVTELRHFAKFCGLDGVDEKLKPYQGTYNPKRPKNQKIVPTDEEIETLLPHLINPKWRYVFCMMATYGLRNHEVWNSTLEYRTKQGRTFPVCLVADGKTGSREVYPMPSYWVELFKIDKPNLPELSVSQIRHGEKSARAFWRQCDRLIQLDNGTLSERPKWKPYSLRHAYAIRCIRAGLPDAISSKWMGHSIATFRDIYSKWINQSQSEDIWLELDI